MSTNTLAACYAVPTTIRTLAIDIGGSGLKACVVDSTGAMVTEKLRIETPTGAAPAALVAMLVEMVRDVPDWERVAVGFPGMVRDGIVRTAPNLGHDGWRGYPLADELQAALGKPVRLCNDADMQGLAVIAGKGLEMVVTLGTGFGTGLYDNGRLCPHLELSQHPFRKGETYDEQLGDAARRRIGQEKWTRRVQKAIDTLRTLTHFDHLYLGGGNSKKLGCELPGDVSLVDNTAGLLGGAFAFDSVRG
ncbi:MAG: ROK family protein [Planctomycetes bacterium]|nr:ROK family protein [Planctomycetota bacterium]